MYSEPPGIAVTEELILVMAKLVALSTNSISLELCVNTNGDVDS